jgi:hypothetical protein
MRFYDTAAVVALVRHHLFDPIDVDLRLFFRP